MGRRHVDPTATTAARPRGLAGRSHLVDGLVVAFSLVLGLLVLEILLRIDDQRPAAEYAEVALGPPDYRLFDDPAKLTDLGGRIAFLGDSFTEGSACGRDGNYPARFAELARASSMADGTINLGVIDTNTYAYLTAARDLIAGYGAPKGAVATLYINDIEYNCALCPHLAEIEASGRLDPAELAMLAELCASCAGQTTDAQAHFGPLRRLHRWLYDWSHAYRFGREAAYAVLPMVGLQVGWGAAYPDQWRDRDGLRFRLLALSIDLLAAEFRARDVPFLIVIYPPMGGLRADNPFVAIYEESARLFAEHSGAPVLSGYPAFLGQPDAAPEMRYSLTDGHPNCQAHGLFAAWVHQQYDLHFGGTDALIAGGSPRGDAEPAMPRPVRGL